MLPISPLRPLRTGLAPFRGLALGTLFVVGTLWTMGCGDNIAGGTQACEASGCHGTAGTDNGIEIAHAGAKLLCTDCHGGDGEARDKQLAHVAPAPQWVADRNGYLKNLSVNELDQVAPSYLQFKNPGDYRVAEKGCGKASTAAAGTACHQNLVDSAPRNVMATFVGHFNVPRFQAGMQDRPALFGSRTIADLDPPSPAPRGSVLSIEQAVIPAADAPRDQVSTLMDNYLPKNCTHCHQWSYGKNDARGNFRSSGCTSCHMLYSNDGVSLSTDPSAVKERPPHAEKHELTTKIPDTQCEHCHFQGARIGLLYRGVVENGFPGPAPFPNIGESLHNHPPEFYLQASSDPAHPADLHFDAGMGCADCHVGRDVHGDGRIYSSSKFQVAVRCENCHGNVDETVSEGKATAPLTRTGTVDDCKPAAAGDRFLNCAGDPLKALSRKADGTVWLRPKSGGDDLQVRQIKKMIDDELSPNMTRAMGRDPTTGFSHTEVITCHGCHTAYRQYCFGCHITMDYSQTKSDLLTGMRTVGAEVTKRQDYSLDLYFLGINRNGRISSFCPSTQAFLTAIDEDSGGNRVTLFKDRPRRAASGKVGFNWGVDTPHVVSSIPQNCSTCHAKQQDACSTSKARETYGFGTNRFTFTDEDGLTHDLTQLLDGAGDPIIEFSHEGQGAVPRAMRDRAMSICVEDDPR